MMYRDENTAPPFYCCRDGQQQREESGLKTIRYPSVLMKWRSSRFFLKWNDLTISCLASPAIILISPDITDTRNAAQWYRAPFSDGKITLVKNGRLRAKKRGGSMLDMVNREKTPVFILSYTGWSMGIPVRFTWWWTGFGWSTDSKYVPSAFFGFVAKWLFCANL
jgi:hypothetical protein